MKLSTALITGEPLLIEPEKLKAHILKTERLLASPMMKDRAPQDPFWAYYYGKRPKPEVINGVSVIPVSGVITTGASDFDCDLGACDVQDVSDWMDEAAANPAVRAVMLDINTPGGTGIGVPELADKVRNFPKPIVAFTGVQCCSAGYWIASAAERVIATPSSYVGSIGVYIAIEDLSKAYDNFGVKMEVIKSGDLKAAGVPGTSLTDAQRANMQDLVDALHADFKAAVTMRRTGVAEDSMRGQSFKGKDAAALGLITGLVSSRAEALTSI